MIGTKKCHRCGKIKPYTDFYKCSHKKDGLQTQCKECQNKSRAQYYRDNIVNEREKHRNWYQNNKEYARKTRREYYSRNRDIILKRVKEYNKTHKKQIHEAYLKKRLSNIEYYRKKQREYQRNNRDKVRAWNKKYRDTHKERLSEIAKEYRLKNKDKINKRRNNRKRYDKNFKLKEQLRNNIRDALRRKNHHKKSQTQDIVGCDLNFLCDYLFKTWERRYGKKWSGEPYHIDHIIPLATAKTENDVIKLCHYTNLQLLTPEDNIEKGTKL